MPNAATLLERWFSRNARKLPWRTRRTGYSALVAEAMLQQTQVARVERHHREFMRRFPTVRALAAASEQEVLGIWAGLGYYRRARHLHAAAQVIVAEHGGRVPRGVDELLRLPGVGRYTAGAIASIVYGVRTPLVDGNVARVLARWHGRRERVDASRFVTWAWQRARELVEQAERPGRLNEALMEIGATVCTPRNPRCAACPLAARCAAHANGLVHEIPRPKTRPPRRHVHHHAVIVRRGAKMLFEQRPATGLWSGMWQPPTIEAARRLSPEAVEQELHVPVTSLMRIAGFEHLTTHRHVHFHVLAGRTRMRRGVWREPGRADDLPMSNAHRRIVTLAAE